MTIDQILEMLAVGISLGGAFHVTVIRPLQGSINDLRTEISEMRKERIALIERVHSLEVLVARVEQSASNAHHRIDEFLESAHEKR